MKYLNKRTLKIGVSKLVNFISPLRYPGGKNKVYEYISHLVKINNVSSYIEPFAGGAAVALRLLNNNEVNRIIINDYDRSIYAFWYSTIFYTEKLIERIWETNISIDEWYKQKKIQKNKYTVNLFDLGFSTLFLNRTNRSGIIKAGVIGGKEQSGEYKMDCRFNKEVIIQRIKLISSLRERIEIHNLDAIDFIKKRIKTTRRSLTFFDPPYYNKGEALYTNFYNYNEHVELSKAISQLMRNRYWILTYDISKEIKDMYSKYNYIPILYNLNYSISTPKIGYEFMFFSRNINRGNIKKYLQVTK